MANTVRPYLPVMLVLMALGIAMASAEGMSMDRVEPMCPKMGVSTSLVATCTEFYPSGPAIRVPKDTTTVKYGMVDQFMEGGSGAFYDRTGKSWPYNASVGPVTDDIMKLNQLVVTATFTNGAITAITPILMIPTETMVKPFQKTSFIGTIINLSPPPNVNATNWFRWDFGTTIQQQDRFTVLKGNFINLIKSVRDSSGRCRPALCSPTSPNSPRCQWYKRFIKTQSISMYWNPAMHTPMDSELVPKFGSGISYMFRILTPNELLATNVKLNQQYSFTIHGSPIGTLFQYVGMFSPLKAPTYCG